MEKLKPCPWCGGTNIGYQDWADGTNVFCQNADCPNYEIRFLIDEWNSPRAEIVNPVVYDQFKSSLQTESERRIQAENTIKLVIIAIDELLIHLRSNYIMPASSDIFERWQTLKDSVLKTL